MESQRTKGDESKQENKRNERYSPEEDAAIVEYITKDNRYLKGTGIQVWKDAEKLKICPGRTYLSLKERYRKVIVKDLKRYKVDKEVAMKIEQFMKASQKGKGKVRLILSSNA